ncbi:unnamed protein product [Leuciscus chuanchicus]
MPPGLQFRPNPFFRTRRRRSAQDPTKLTSGFKSQFNSSLVNGFLSRSKSQFNSNLVNGFLSRFKSQFKSKLVNGFLSRFKSQFESKLVNSFLSRFNSKLVNGFLSRFKSRFKSKLVSSFLSRFNSKLVNGFLSRFKSQFNSKLVNGFLSSFKSQFNSKLVNSFLSRFNSKLVNGFLSRFKSQFNSKLVNGFLSRFKSQFNSKLVNSFLSRFNSKLVNGFLRQFNSKLVNSFLSQFNSKLVNSFLSQFNSKLVNSFLSSFSLSSQWHRQIPLTNEDSGYVVYENRMTSSYEVGIGPLGSITRDSHFELLFQCRYSGTSVEALVVEVNTVPPPPPVAAPGPLRVELRLANGQCVTKGCAEGDEAYTSYYSDADYPVTKVLREPVYVEVHILERTDPNIVLMLGRCWATSTPSPLSLPQWDLLVDGCPYQDDRYLTTLVPVAGSSGLQFPTHYKRFVVKMFTFVDPASLAPLQETIFIHCSTAVCHPSSGSCEQSCTRKKALKGGKPGADLIEWTEEMEEAFVTIKETLASSPALRHADTTRPFHLWTWVGNRSYSAALGQKVPGRSSYGMVGYYSAPIPVFMAGQHPCLMICDCAEWAVKTTENIVTHQKVILHTRHQILKLLTNTHLGSISNQRRAKWEATLLNKNVEIQIDTESAINPASLLPDEGAVHNCARLIETDSQSPLQSEPLSDAMNLFVDGSSFHEQGKRFTGWAVVNEHGETVDCGSLSGGGAQVAELVALTRALQHSKGRRVNI